VTGTGPGGGIGDEVYGEAEAAELARGTEDPVRAHGGLQRDDFHRGRRMSWPP